MPIKDIDEDLETKLRNFGKNLLKPSEESIKKSNAAIDEIRKVLQAKSRVKIDRIIPAGSYGKSTALAQHYDIDLVVFVNDKEPPFENVLKDFEDILELDERLNVSDIHTTSHSLQFSHNGIEFDLLPATNFIKSQSFSDRHEAIERQREMALAKMQSEFDQTGKYDSSFSSALAESQVEFLKGQTAFVHSLVRLLKFWFKTLQVDYIYGQGLMIELIAVFVGEKMESVEERSMIQGFLKCLEMVIGFNLIHINVNPNGKTPQRILNCAGSVIMDPTNPFNNIADGIEPQAITKLIGYAKETKGRILAFPNCAFLELIFAPQPTKPMKSSIPLRPMVGIKGGVPYSHPNMVVNGKSTFTTFELEELKRRIQQTIVTQVQAMVADKKPGTSNADCQTRVQKFVAQHILGRPDVTWGPADCNHEECDVTFVIPFETGEGKSSYWISFKKQ